MTSSSKQYQIPLDSREVGSQNLPRGGKERSSNTTAEIKTPATQM